MIREGRCADFFVDKTLNGLTYIRLCGLCSMTNFVNESACICRSGMVEDSQYERDA